MGRITRIVATLAVASFGIVLGGCGKKAATAVVADISSEAVVPNEIDQLRIDVIRDGSVKYANTYDLKAKDAKLPGTLTIENQDGEDATTPFTITVTAIEKDDKGVNHERIVRQAVMGFVDQKTKLLKMPLRYSCWEFPTVCDSTKGQTCKGGECVPSDIDVSSLPDYSDELVYGVQGAGGPCFDDRDTACLKSIQTLDVSPLMGSFGCSVALSGTSVVETDGGAGSTGAGGSAGYGGSTGAGAKMGPDGGLMSLPSQPPGTRLPMQTTPAPTGTSDGTQPAPSKQTMLNLAAHWKNNATDPTRLVVLDFDANEGWTFTDASSQTVTFAPGVCAAIKNGDIEIVKFSTACAPKALLTPICSPAQSSGTGCAGYAQTVCDKFTCYANSKQFFGRFGSADCVTGFTKICQAEEAAPGSGLNDAALGTCLSSWAGATCDDFWAGGYEARCDFKGTLAVGAPCVGSFQCESGSCSGSSSQCGTCQAAGGRAGLKQPCGSQGTQYIDCAAQYVCNNSVCVVPSKVGDPCLNVGHCPGSFLVCSGGKCIVPKAAVGDSCATDGGMTQSNPCESVDVDLVCNSMTGKCEKRVFAAVGAPCGSSVDMSSQYIDCDSSGWCDTSNGTGTGTCRKYAVEGGSCQTSEACGGFMSCVNGTCTYNEYLACSGSHGDAGGICTAGTTSCPDGCKMLDSDPSNCGYCGNVCADPVCQAGSCSGPVADAGAADITTLIPTIVPPNWLVDSTGPTRGIVQVARTQSDATGYVNEWAMPYYSGADSTSWAVAMARQGYSPDMGKSQVELDLWQMPSTNAAALVYQNLPLSPMYMGITFQTVAAGQQGRLGGTMPSLFLSFQQGVYIVELKANNVTSDTLISFANTYAQTLAHVP